ncbi:hypothetical protein HYV43_00550 [Candidatus Micrarchaeota archaeon]|nr:hypothetical protein [Candidatus Micrarchaeota archaeon]
MRPLKPVFFATLKFLGLIVLFAALAYGVLVFTPLEKLLAAYTAHATAFLLSTLGQVVTVTFQANPHLLSDGFDAELIPLCWGTVELALWAGIVLGTDNRSWNRRLKGLIGGTLVFLAFNPARIALTLRLFDASQPFASSVAHDVLFRISLVALFVVAYFVWYEWPQARTAAA